MKKYLLKALLIVVAAVMAVPLSAYGNNAVNITTKLDSTVLLMGKQTALHIEILQGKDVIGDLTNVKSDTLCNYVEIIELTDADTTDLGNNRLQINRDLIIQSFDSGLYVLPPIQYVVNKDTFKSSPLTLKVMPVNVDTMTTVHPYKSVEDVPFHLFDFLPDFIVDYWWIFLIVILIIIIGVAVYMFMLKKDKIFISQPPVIPPYDEAMQRLEELKSRKLWQSGQDKEYYTILTDILRRYIDRRFSINAMEMTSSQIISVLRKNQETKAVNEQLEQILEIADFVKFAKIRPLPDDNEASYNRAVNFVNETKPVEPDKDKTDSTDNQTQEPKGGVKA